MSEEKEVGKVVETATPREFLFRAAAGEEIALHDYVRVPVKDAGKMREVLAEVTGLGAKNQLAKEAYDPDVIMPELTYKLLEADVLGYYDDDKKRVIRPRSAPNPGSSVWRAETEFLRKFFEGDKKRLPISIGRLMNNQDVDVPIYLNDMQFHLGILASSLPPGMPIIYKKNGVASVDRIGDVVDPFYSEGGSGVPVSTNDMEVVSLDTKTHAVSWAPVQYVYRHEYTGDLVKLVLETGRIVETTPNHSIYTFEDGKVVCKNAAEIQIGDYVVGTRYVEFGGSVQHVDILNIMRRYRFKPGDGKKFSSFYLYGVPLDAAKKVAERIYRSKGYKKSTSYLREHGVGIEYADIVRPEIHPSVRVGYHSKAARFPTQIEMTQEMARLLGYYVAEGHTRIEQKLNYRLTFDLGKDDENTIFPDLVDILKGLNCKPIVQRNKKSIRVHVANKILALFVGHLCGRGAENKKIPDIILNSPSDVRLAFVKAWIQGDGGVTVSSQLINEVAYALLFEGSAATIAPGKLQKRSRTEIDGRAIHQRHRAWRLSFPDSAEFVETGQLRLIRMIKEPLYPAEKAPEPLRSYITKKSRTTGTVKLTPMTRHSIVNHMRKLLSYVGEPVKKWEENMHDGMYRTNRNRYLASFKGKIIPNQTLKTVVEQWSDALQLADSSVGFFRVKSADRVKSRSKFVYDVSVPSAENFLAGVGGVFCHNTRSGKSFLAGRMMEEILQQTPFPCVVIDMHGDYISLDMSTKGVKHSMFGTVVYHPPGAPIEDGITAKMESLDLSPADMTEEQIVALINAVAEIGGLQETAILNAVDELKAGKKPFTLTDIISLLTESMNEKNEKDKYVMPNEDRTRVAHIVVRLQRLQKTLKLPSVGMSAADMLEPNRISVICLAGLQSKVQDAYAGIILDQLFKYMVEHKKEAPPVFVFIEEAHRIASSTGKTDFAGRTISTIIREGAKFKIFLTLISQRPRSIDPDILANVGNVIALRITNEQDQQTILAASESFSKRLVEDLPRLNQGEAVIVGPFVPQAAHIQTKPRETVHHGASADLWEEKERLERKKKQKSDGKIKW